jgi:hypothetical protein
MLEMSVLVLALGEALAGPLPERCSVLELRNSPGYQYRVERIADFVDSAEVIVRVQAIQDTTVEDYPGRVSTAIRFRILESLRGAADDSMLVLPGQFVDRDDFNPRPVPYQMVRPSGQRGWCFTREYRRNREYLLLLRSVRGRLTTEWRGLAPFNEQVQGTDDDWVRWVRAQVDATNRPARDGVITKPTEPPPYIALRLVVREFTPGAERAEDGDSTVFLAPRPLLSDTDLVRVTALPRSDEPLIIRVHCRPAACERLAGITANAIGHSVALVIDSRVRGVAPIMSSVGTGGSMTLQTGATGAEAERIVQQIRTRWPPQ